MAVDFDALLLGPLMREFGVPVTYLPAGGGEIQIHAVLDRTAQQLDFDHETAPVSTTKPVLGVRLSDFKHLQSPSPCPGQGDLVEIGDELFVVKDVNPDGVGHARLGLLLKD